MKYCSLPTYLMMKIWQPLLPGNNPLKYVTDLQNWYDNQTPLCMWLDAVAWIGIILMIIGIT